MYIIWCYFCRWCTHSLWLIPLVPKFHPSRSGMVSSWTPSRGFAIYVTHRPVFQRFHSCYVSPDLFSSPMLSCAYTQGWLTDRLILYAILIYILVGRIYSLTMIPCCWRWGFHSDLFTGGYLVIEIVLWQDGFADTERSIFEGWKVSDHQCFLTGNVINPCITVDETRRCPRHDWAFNLIKKNVLMMRSLVTMSL